MGRRLATWFPDREFFMRSQGQVRFIKITSRMQIAAASIAVAALFAWAISMAVMGWSQYRAEAERASLLDREARVATKEERFDAYSNQLDDVAADLQQRQEFIEAMVDSLPDDVRAEETVSDSSTEAQATVDKVSALIPEAAALAKIEARQLVFVERLTRFADRRAARAAKAIRDLGLNPDSMIRNADRSAMGGPLEQLASAANGDLDPRFERLGLSLARMTALERTLEGIPQVAPASRASISSGFGYRSDPFTRAGAMHSGLDFKGPMGAPIHSAAKGRVTYVGWKSGYGKTVEVSHGNGLMTRYAHMSRFNAKVGQQVDAGDVIGAIGSTGRSTGPHLHFEVRINNRAVNPRPFLEKAPNVLKEVRAAGSAKQAGA
ncbi:peptidoglycan DD-metalloendopeptidase family protein [Erythrobacter sp. HKB08]|uniref:peptidoglycan DD-metalloendopeptidase family protein n=1 Tax=Erythrobacter sp. HKB08 TaxID=2502843 RepID=UPI001F272147|nr:peptidoglycan DD-metalloendopeptidase family protein [Erythrobacter sp. HKB08]